MDDKELLGTEFGELEWAVEGVLPIGATVVAGKAKSGKSWMTYQMAIAIADGTPFMGRFATNPGDVLYLGLEDSPRRMKQRLRMLAPDREPNGRLVCETMWPTAQNGGYEELERWIEDHPDTRAVFVDNMACFDAVGYAYRRDSEILRRASKLAWKYGIAVVLVFHMYKGPGISKTSPDWTDKIQGSVGVSGAADGIWGVARDRGEPTGVLRITGKDVEEQTAAVLWDKATGRWALANLDEEAETVVMTEARQQLFDAIHANPGKTPTQVAELVGKTYNGVKAQLWAMLDGNVIVRRDGLLYTPLQIQVMEAEMAMGDAPPVLRRVGGRKG